MLLTPTPFPKQDGNTNNQVNNHPTAGDYNTRSPLENIEMAMIIMDSTSQKKQGGSSFLPRIPSSEHDLAPLHSMGGGKFNSLL